MDDRRVLTVTELNGSIRTLLESRFPFISVGGEISNLHKPYSGHYYFTLKDSGAQIRAVLFKMQQRYLHRPPRDGDQVVCRGRISVYEPRGEYQLIVDTVDFQGTGPLQLAFERLKRRLAAEGLFDEHTKRSLPPFPSHITLVTSPQGAAVHDFIRIATRRCPMVRIAVYPVAVQGDQAAADIIQALADINAGIATDLIVLCRGGGSIEDLWAFNDEHLARAIRQSILPVVSAVGHEIDFTIADFAADLRAPTPSGAAELLIPDGEALQRTIDQLHARLRRSLGHRIDRVQQRVQLARHRLETMAHPLDRLSLHLDLVTTRLERALRTALDRQQRRMDQVFLALTRQSPVHRMHLHRQRLQAVHLRLLQAGRLSVHGQEERLARAAGLLHAVSPLATLARGYAIVRKTERKKDVVTASSQVKPGESVAVMLHRGELRCRVEETRGSEATGISDDQSRTASTS
jgi:exodeoxyribonuclease VII large subunit